MSKQRIRAARLGDIPSDEETPGLESIVSRERPAGLHAWLRTTMTIDM